MITKIVSSSCMVHVHNHVFLCLCPLRYSRKENTGNFLVRTTARSAHHGMKKGGGDMIRQIRGVKKEHDGNEGKGEEPATCGAGVPLELQAWRQGTCDPDVGWGT
eukprot:761634-Hanusia_phi.AAC.1